MFRLGKYFYKYFLVFLMMILTAFFPQSGEASWLVLPENHHHQFQSYGLFFEQQSALLFKQSGRASGAIAAVIALVENRDWKYQPQLILHGSANAAFSFNSKGDTLLTETDDARVGLSVDLQFTEKSRGAVVWTHQSGHISDNVSDADLIGSNLGNEILTLRFTHDIDDRFRLGGGPRITLGSDPGMLAFGAEQFFEWFPKGENQNQHEFSPFFAFGAEEYGRRAIRLTLHAQVGFYAGSHFRTDHHPTLRVVFGYYNGNDPRMKYYQMKDSRVDFFYSGLMFDL